MTSSRLLAIAALLLALLAVAEITPAAAQSCPTRSTTPASDPRLTQDCNTLLELKATLEGTATLDWARNTDPLTAWEGVFADATNGVTEINPGYRFNSNTNMDEPLTGSIPPALGNLPNLQVLNLGGNELTGAIPTELGKLTNLTQLNLSANQLDGGIPDLSTLTSLQYLHLYRNELTGSIPATLGNLPNLQQLDLHGNQLTDPIPADLGNLTNLTRLNLHNNQLTGTIPTELDTLTSLTHLHLSNNQLEGGIPDLSTLTSLKELYLHQNRLTGAEELGTLASSLTHLHLYLNQLDGDIPDLSTLTNLRELYLQDNQLTGKIPTWLGSLTSLRDLRLSNNRLTGSIPEELGTLTDLSFLYLDHNRLTGSVPEELGKLVELQRLYLACNPQLTGTVPSTIFTMTDLRQVALYGTALTLPAGLSDDDRQKVVPEEACSSPPTEVGNNPHSNPSDDGSTRRACPPLVPPLLPIIGQTAAATTYALPGDRALLHLHASAADSVVLDVGHIAADGATRVPGAFVRDADRGHTYTLLRRAADGLIVRHWLAPTDPLTQSVPWDRVNTAHTFPAAVLAAIPLDDRHAASNQLARVFDGTDERILAFDATRGQWWHVSHPSLFRALGFAWDDVTAADADFVQRLFPERAAPFPRIISRTAIATAYEVPGDRLVLHHHDALAPPVVIGVGWIATAGTAMVPMGFVRDADRGQTYAVVRREVDGLIVRYWIAPTDPLVQAIPWERVTTQYTLPAAVLATVPLDERYPQANQLTRRFDELDDRIWAYDAGRRQWWHVPDLATLHGQGFVWQHVTAADPAFFTRIATGAAVPQPLPPPPLAPAPAEEEECPPPPPSLPRLIGQTATATAYELPGDRALLHLHASAAASAVLGIGWIAADGAARVPVGFVRDDAVGHTYAVVRRAADGLIARHWVAATDPLIYSVPWDRVTTHYTFPVAALTAFPLDERHPQPDQLARRFDGTDDRVLAYDAELGQWAHVPDLATFQARGYYWCDVTGADAAFFDRINQGLPYPASSVPAQPDYPSCRP